MKVLCRIQTDDFELVIRGNRVAKNQAKLATALQKRGHTIPSAPIRFAKPVCLHTVQKPNIYYNYLHIQSQSISFYQPVFFENSKYEFDFHFSELVNSAELQHPLERIQENFYFENQLLHTGVDFGNDIGRFQLPFSYQKAGKTIEQILSFEVWPTKMDMRSDLDKINHVLDETHPLLRFSFAKNSSQGFARSKQKHPPFDVLWIAQFQELHVQILKGFKQVLSAPHNRLTPENKQLKAHQLKGKLSPKLLQKVKQDLHGKQFDRRYQVQQKHLSVDTPENQFIKYVLQYLINKTQNFSHKAATWNKKSETLSSHFFSQLACLSEPFKRLQQQPLLKEVSDFQGMTKASLVLQQKTGYSTIYRSWFELKTYLDLLGDDSNMALKNVAELYEVWCFLEMRRIFVKELEFTEVNKFSEFATKQGMEYQIPSGEKHAFEFVKGDGAQKIKVTLRHEKSFGSKNKSARDSGIIAWMAQHKPDIYLEVEFSCGSKFIWLFDAKYRIDLDSDDKDWVPQDALYQMHRYRDALLYRDRPDEDLSRPVYGAYALYPGYFNNQPAGKNPYHESIENIDIGAFPMLPGHNQTWLVNFLKDTIIGNLKNSSIKSEEASYEGYTSSQPRMIKKRSSAKIRPL